MQNQRSDVQEQRKREYRTSVKIMPATLPSGASEEFSSALIAGIAEEDVLEAIDACYAAAAQYLKELLDRVQAYVDVVNSNDASGPASGASLSTEWISALDKRVSEIDEAAHAMLSDGTKAPSNALLATSLIKDAKILTGSITDLVGLEFDGGINQSVEEDKFPWLYGGFTEEISTSIVLYASPLFEVITSIADKAEERLRAAQNA